MKSLTSDSRWSGLKRRLLMVALLAGIAGSQVGCGCECAAIGTLTTIAAGTPTWRTERGHPHSPGGLGLMS
jgi:hypothetical protein